MTADEPEGFLGRWSRVKRTAARSVPEAEPVSDPEAPGEADANADDATAQAAEVAPATLSEEELAALPRIEDLVQGSDIRPFLRAGVPRSMRNAAMRRIWMLTPGIRDYRDPAVDYAWDWNTPGGVPGDGVAPSPERAAQMLQSLLAPRAQPAPVDGAGEAGDAPEARAGGTAPEAGDGTAEIPPDLVQDQITDGSTETVAGPADRPEAEPDPLPRRRHGSALPG